MIKQKYFLISGFLIFFLHAQTFSQSKDSTSKFTFSGYVDAYYGYYNDSVGDNNFQKFPTVAPRGNQFGLNIAMFTAKYESQKVRSQATIHFGDIPKSAWSANYNFIQEANAGVRLGKKVWLDAGFFRTHMGTEGLLPKENFTSSVAVVTIAEPFYESGVRLNYNPTEKIAFYFLALNGYGMFEDNNKYKSFGMLVTYAISDSLNIGYNNYIGDDTPTGADTISHLHILQNVFINYSVDRFKFQVGGDYCFREHAKLTNTGKPGAMFSGIFSIKYIASPKVAPYVRAEIFNDPDGIMGPIIVDRALKSTGYKLWGATAGLEFKPTENSFIRLEGRELIMDKDQQIFYSDGFRRNNRLEVLCNTGVWF